MENSKLYSILQHFNKYEQNRFRKFVQSPYFNANPTLVRLFEILVRHQNNGQEEELGKEHVWALLETGDPYDDVRFRKHCSDLLKLVETYLVQEVFQENPLHQATYLIEAVGRKKLEKLYNSTMRSARRLSSQQPHQSAVYYFYQFQIEKNYYELTKHFRKRDPITNIEKVTLNLDLFFLAEKLKHYCRTLVHQYAVSHEYRIFLIEEIIAHVEQYRYEDIPPIAVYYQIYLALVNTEEEEHYYKLKELLEKHGLAFPQEEAADIYSYAINYCTRKINKGNQNFLREYFDLYKDLLKKNILIVEGEMLTGHFRNIVTVGLRLGEIQWTEDFIHEYKQYLPEAQRDNLVTFNLAQLYFYKKDYDAVIELLQHVEYDDVTYNLNSKTLLLLTYYETDEIEPLFSLTESFRAYLNRHKNIPTRRRRSYMQLIKFVKKLTRAMPGDRKQVSALRQELQAAKGVASVKWIQEKIAELE
ncbi:MAG: hypothetical protein KDC43_16085 [Saprospiraceae bacterium]|nr:hypothetical protein [Saprospiraceae bacterium]MCB0625388.1 hypothetical protein [Saprospiraceae bacterium]MCB0675097.1 hypothetical protein [Saprospiraceae bacterium]MCB0679610.1 hypothetical protein [Saprospiraceae bacterium]